jgi:hypothetical protein
MVQVPYHVQLDKSPGLYPKAEEIFHYSRPLVETTRLTKAILDGGSGLNLMYLDTFERLGLAQF